ncbi:MAG: phosphatidylglycerophosphatase A [Candidatus Omnitrophica bacterium]|nr:phosphatidylglycerophosphatase A [Candidatus Omnitrophota bacterium]MBU2044322.1 phosphatidylglycerophosphatase A [Candidatus Omnitrophota bacterium]
MFGNIRFLKGDLSPKDRLVLIAATVFGVGYTPLCPGTASCLVALPVFLFIKNPVYFAVFTLASLIISFLVCGRAEKLFGQKDSKLIVIDDFSGMLITYLFIPHDFRYLVCGFFLFRMLDMLKIPPADTLERCPGAKGVVGDDLVAGVYANLILHSVRLILAIFS